MRGVSRYTECGYVPIFHSDCQFSTAQKVKHLWATVSLAADAAAGPPSPQIRHAAEGEVGEAAKDVGQMAKEAATVRTATYNQAGMQLDRVFLSG